MPSATEIGWVPGPGRTAYDSRFKSIWLKTPTGPIGRPVEVVYRDDEIVIAYEVWQEREISE